MKQSLLFLLCLTILSCNINKEMAKRTQTKLPDRPFTQQQIAEDIDYYTNMVEKICPFPYLFTQKKTVDSIAKAIKSHPTMETLAFYEQFMKLQASYNVGHLYSSFPSIQLGRYLRKGGTLFPVMCGFEQDSLRVRMSFDTAAVVKNGDIILTINGLKADSLLKSFYGYTGGLLETKNRRACLYFGSYLWLNNIYPPYKVGYLNKNKQYQVTTILGVNRTTSSSKSVQITTNTAIDRIITYERIQDTIAYINFKSMSITDVAGFEFFLENTFKDIKEKKTTMLIVDLHKNGGGNSTNGMKLLDYFTSKDYRMAADKKWLVSHEYKQSYKRIFPWYYRPIAVVKSGFGDYFRHHNGELFGTQAQNEALHHPEANPYRFNGPVFMLISNHTYSSAVMTANAVQDFKLATLVGEPTGECPNDLGEIVPIHLPNSQIVCWIPSALFTRTNGDEKDPNPVLPNIYLEDKKLENLKDVIWEIERSKR